jgi:uncharacterized protein (DUF924 family)
MPSALARPADVLDFWFDGARTRPEWFRKDDAFDDAIRQRFAPTIEAALADALDPAWSESPQGTLARIVVLDQFTRNTFRGSPRAFAGDVLARAAARWLVEAGDDRRLLPAVRRQFVYLQFEHAENLDDQRLALQLFEALAAEDAQFADLPQWARKHLVVIERFGRFPHRNAVLGRASTADEIEFLKQPGASF